MELKRLSAEVSVAGQITPANVDAIAVAGFKSLICNRPDGEDPNQPTYSEIAAAAARNGLEIRHQPVISGRVGNDNAVEFGRLVGELPKPVLAYCRSGTRCAQLWTLWQAD